MNLMEYIILSKFGTVTIDNILSATADITTEQQAQLRDNLDAQQEITASGILKGDGNGGVSAAVPGTDYDTASNIVSATAAMTPAQAAQTRQNIGADTPETVTEWLDAHVNPDTGYVIDDTLTIQGAAADAKATGDAVGELKSAINNDALKADYEGKIFDISSPMEQTVSAKLTSTNESVDIWQHGKNLLPPTEGFSMGDVTVTVEPDGTFVFNGTVSAGSIKDISFNAMPFVNANNAIFPNYVLSHSMNKAVPNTSGSILFQVTNQLGQNIFADGINSSTPLTISTNATYNDTSTAFNVFRIRFYNIPNGVEFDNWKIKVWVNAVNVEEYSKPSLSHKTVAISDGSATANIVLAEGANHVITNADSMQFSAQFAHKTSSYYGKRWACFGDSLTQKDSTAIAEGRKRYFDLVSEQLGLTIVNYGRATTGYTTTGNVSSGQYYARMQMINPALFDFITIMGSTNDVAGIAQGTIEIGNYDDTGTTTVCGCINTTLDNYYAVAPLKPIGVISMLPTYAYGPNLIDTTSAENYVNALKQICANRGIPFLDLYHGSGMRPWNETVKAALYADGDGIHPNNEGIKWFAPAIREFVKRLM